MKATEKKVAKKVAKKKVAKKKVTQKVAKKKVAKKKVNKKDNTSWGDSQHANPLLDCLLLLAAANNIDTSPATILAGLPLQYEQLTPSLFNRAAQRAGFSSQLAKRPLEQLNTALFPVILLLEGNQACLLLEFNAADGVASVVYPELGSAKVETPLSELLERYTGRAIYARPKQRFDARVTDIKVNTDGHWFWQVIKAHRGLYRDVLLASLMINVFAVAMPLFVLNVYDRVVPNFALDTLWVLALGVIVVLTADLCLKMMRVYFVDLAASRIDISLSATIMARVLGMKMSERPDSIGSFTSGLQAFESVRGFIGSSTVITFIDLPFVILFSIVIGLLCSWLLLIPIVIGVIICLLYAASVQNKMRELSINSMQASAHRNSVLVESLNGLESLKMLSAEGKMQRIWEQTSIFLSRNTTKTRLLSGSVTTGSLWIQQVVGVSIIIVGVYLIVGGELTQGGLIAAYLLSSRIMGPMGQTAGLMMQYHQAATALEGMEAVMNKEVERPVGKTWISRPRLAGGIEFKKVFSRYPNDERDVLSDVSFKINPGERVALLGRNGSGKSTIQKLIAGLYESSQGSVMIDHLDIGQLDKAELRRNIGYVAQDVNLFLGTLRDNITMGDPNVSDEHLLEIISICGLTEFINSHPSGLAMPVGERGNLLSGGQRQSISIARALISNPTILLLDEPTGSMDHSSEMAFKKSLEEFSNAKTLLVVTHRTSLLEMVDRIIVIDEGKVVADGPKEQVVEALCQGRIGRAN